MTITTTINAIGLVKATEMIQSARAEAAIEHKAGLHTVSMPAPPPNDAGIQRQKNDPKLLASQERVVDITV
ncbi:hypothetical protein SAMN04488144_13446 [Methylobacterium sp. 190mf]|uniref:hypothetical protein n=1 Tax=Methylobacterium sp. 190mf TaxID=1761798 RepID=UPI00089E8C44|nr:hypothetical protein [Methylobacterium sp. 190mf]SEG65770.1 hypothetical protein SAMN04488144_13446 [Methylobacterium sp. 190mf]